MVLSTQLRCCHAIVVVIFAYATGSHLHDIENNCKKRAYVRTIPLLCQTSLSTYQKMCLELMWIRAAVA